MSHQYKRFLLTLNNKNLKQNKMKNGICSANIELSFTCFCRKCIQSQQTRYIDSMLGECWPTVFDVDPTLTQHWVNVSCLLGIMYSEILCRFNLVHRLWCWASIKLHDQRLVFAGRWDSYSTSPHPHNLVTRDCDFNKFSMSPHGLRLIGIARVSVSVGHMNLSE